MTQAAGTQGNARSTNQEEVRQAIEDAQRAVQDAARSAREASRNAQQAAEAGQVPAIPSPPPPPGTIVFPSENGNPDVRISVNGDGTRVQQGEQVTTIPIRDVVPRGAVQIAYAVSAALIAIAIVGPLLRFFLRRVERRGVSATLSAGVQARLDAMERNIDTVAIELERVSEGQRFTAKLLEQRPLEHAQRSDR